MPTFCSLKEAAEFVHKHLPDEPLKYWVARLNNLRRTDRPQPYRLQYAKVEGKAGFYDRDDLVKFVEFEKTRRIGKMKLSARAAEALRAFGVGTPHGSCFGRKLDWTVSPQFDEVARTSFVQLTTAEPFLVFRLELADAESLARDLSEAVQQARDVRNEVAQAGVSVVKSETVISVRKRGEII